MFRRPIVRLAVCCLVLGVASVAAAREFTEPTAVEALPDAGFVWEPFTPIRGTLVTVTNFPVTQNVNGEVSVTNLPAVQQVGGTVNIGNLPTPTARLQLVGFTLATFPGGTGVFGLTRACQVEFPGSRMCLLEEALTTVNIPDLSSSGNFWAWARMPGADTGNNCNGWNDVSGGAIGRAIGRQGQYGDYSCDHVFSVACCAPTE
jgi:hypothetical protein